MSSQLFGTDGIRGPAGVYPLDSAGMQQIGRAVGQYFTMPGETIVVGWDPRESSAGLVNAMVDGLASMGVEVRKTGVVPTPGLAYLTKQQKARAGVMITASHNPYTDNGVKVFTAEGRKLPDDVQSGLNDLITKDHIADRGPGTVSEDPKLVGFYEDFLTSSVKGTKFDKINIALDSANGATSGIAEHIFTKLGAKVTPMFDKPDGRNINVQCGATDTTALRKAVSEQGLQAGVAFDGDGDRVIIVDEKGRELTGDHILYILAVTGHHKGVVATIMSNMGLETALKRQGIALTRTAVGDRFVVDGMDSSGYILGGEQSGHIIMSQYSPTGDGLLAAVKTLEAVLGSDKTLGQWYDELQLVPQALVNIPLGDKSLLEKAEVKAYVGDQVKQLGNNGRLNIRPSGTEPKARVMVEAQDAPERAKAIADQLIKLTSEF